MRIPPYVGWPLIVAWLYVVLYFLANRVIYQPTKYPRGWWEAQQEVGAADVWLETPDGVKLHAWWRPVNDSRLVTLYLHGNAGNVSHRGAHIREIAAAGSSVLVLDYRGYGKSKGRPTEKGLYTDAETAFQHLIGKGYRPEQIILHGESLGSAVAVELATRRPAGGLVMEAPFTSAGDVAGRILPFLGPLVVRGFKSKKKIARVRAPILIIHGDMDGVIDTDLSRALFEAAPEPKTFWAVPGAGHNDIVEAAGRGYRQRLQAFYSTVQPQK